MKRFLLIICLPVFLVACDVDAPRVCPLLPSGGAFCLRPTSEGPLLDLRQKVEVQFKERRETMIVDLSISPNAISYVAVTPFGLTLAKLRFDNHTLQQETAPIRRLDPALLLALVQIALWPADSVRAGLGDGLVLSEIETGRLLMQNGNTVVEVGYTCGRPTCTDMKIELASVGVSFDIRTLKAGQP